MEDDNLLINDSTFFYGKEPIDQIISRKKEKANTLEALPILEELVQYLEGRIAHYEANSSIPDKVRTDPQKFLIIHNSYTIAAEQLTLVKEDIQGLIAQHAR